MTRQLEFELETTKNGENQIHYIVMRKGLTIGHLTLQEPYNKPQAIRILMTLHDQPIQTKHEIIEQYKKDQKRAEFTNVAEILRQDINLTEE